MLKVIKRDGCIVDFNGTKIENAIKKAFAAAKATFPDEYVLNKMMANIMADLNPKIKDNAIEIEDIQDAVEKILAESGFYRVAKEYIIYRLKHQNIRNVAANVINFSDLMGGYLDRLDWRVKENSTVQYTLGGLILSNSGAVTANYWLHDIYDREIAEAHKDCLMHIHDLSMLSGYCAGWSLKQLINEGIKGVAGKISSAPASHLSTLCNQMVNFLGIMQNEWAGAQAFSSFDTYLAPFIKADHLTFKEAKQAIQSFVFGVNTPSRWGCVDTDTEVLSVEGFKRYNELKEGDLIYTWNNGKLELNPVRKVITKPFKGRLHKYGARGYNQTVTPNHRMLVKVFNKDEFVIRRSDEVFNLDTPHDLPVAFLDSGIKPAPLSDAEIKLAAMVYTDGNIDMREQSVHKVCIFKSPKRTGHDDLKEICAELGLEYSEKNIEGGLGIVTKYSFYGESARAILKLVESKKKISDQFFTLNQHQADLFLHTWASFDGHEEKMRCQYDNDTIRDQLQQIAILAGHTSYVYQNGKANYVKMKHGQTIYPTIREEVEYDGIVWCPNVENGTAVFRKDGCVYISGQTQAPFTNITLDWKVPEDLKNLPAIVGGKEMDFTYGDCQAEMDIINKAFLMVMNEGDADGRGFQYPIPTYSITKNFDWSDTENNRLLFEMTAKYGAPYFSNYMNSDMDPSDIRSMCCRLRLDLRELRRRNGGFFGSGESTGSVGVVTLNLPHIAYLSGTEEKFFQNLDHAMDIAARSLRIKREAITKLLDSGLYPYTKAYLGSFVNHFSTIGIVGGNEMCLNAKWLGKDLSHKESQNFVEKMLNHMRNRLSDYQEMYAPDLYNLEATPAESTSYRFAKHDKKNYPDIIAANEHGTPYYTNSTNLPVGCTDDVFDALDIQDRFQPLYTSGTVFHTFLGEKLPSWESAAHLVRTICSSYKLPYISISPTYSVCADHGYFSGEHFKCPVCGQEAEVYSRITGYYRPVKNWNDGKLQEFKDRKVYQLGSGMTQNELKKDSASTDTSDASGEPAQVFKECLLFTTSACPNCKLAKEYLDRAGIVYRVVNAMQELELTEKYHVMQAPTLVCSAGTYVGLSRIKDLINDA